MPKIPTIGFQTRPTGPVAQPRMSAEALAAPAAGLRELGRTVTGVAQQAFEVNEQRAAFEAELQYVENERLARERMRQLQAEAPEGAEGFTDTVQREFNAWLPTAMEKAPNSNRAQQLLRAKYARLESTLLTDAQQFQAQAKTAQQLRRFSDTQVGLMNDARAHPERLSDFLQQGAELANAAPFPNEQVRAEQRRVLSQGVMNSGLDGWVTRFETDVTDAEQVAAAAEALKAGAYGFKEQVDPRAYDQALTRLENRRKGLEVESVANFGKDIADAKVTIQNHGYLPANITYARALQVYKGDEKAARRVMDELNSDLRVYGLQQKMTFTTLADDQAALRGMLAETQGEGAAFKEQDRQEMARAAQAKWQAIAADPVAYVFKQDPSIAEQWRTANEMNDAGERDRVLNLLDKRQETLGIPYYERRFLGKGAAQQVAERLRTMNWEDAANEIEGIQVQYKAHLAPVLRELEEAGVDPLMVGLGYKDAPDDVGLRRLVAEFGQTGIKTLRENAGQLNATDIDKQIADLMPAFNKTMAAAGREGQEIIRRERQMVEIVAYGLHQNGGLTANEAADKAFNMVLGNRYDFGPTYRTPKGELGLVERHAEAAILNARKTPEMFAPVAPGRFADTGVAASPIMQQNLREAAMRNALEFGMWANIDTDAGPGLVRLAPDDVNAGGYAPVRLADGKDWVITFAEMRQAPPPMVRALDRPAAAYR